MGDEWFDNCGGFQPEHNLDVLRKGIADGMLDRQDVYGSTALMLAVWSEWTQGVDELLRAGADTELRYARTGMTAIYEPARLRQKCMVDRLLAGGANPDAANHWGVTPRRWAPELFAAVPIRETPPPEPHIQNAEHLADHHHPKFKIPRLSGRVALTRGQAVGLRVYGPRTDEKGDVVKVRVESRAGTGPATRYAGRVETPLEQTHLSPGTEHVEFGPEHVATVFVRRPG